MKPIISALIIWVVGLLFFYGLLSFYTLSLNPALWSDGARFSFCGFSFVFTGAWLFGVVSALKDETL